jgi:tRNA-5-taurinomethyluridine 2-sulfurtransferase
MKIAVLLSGGVDSSVALSLLQQQGYDVTAFYLKIWLEDELAFLGSCPWEEDLSYVRATCKQLNVPLEVLSFQRAYWDHVVTHTIAEIKAGRTPNPDIMCNQKVKFGAFEEAVDANFDKIATGHYAQVAAEGDYYHLFRAPDPIKDQTYFLAHLSQQQFGKALFPIGHLEKKDVRALAHEFDLPTKDRKDSQGICFLGKIKFSEFVQHHLGIVKGELREVETNKVMGEHDGFWYYTIGQRHSIGLSGGPWYVVAKNVDKNIVYISRTYYSLDKMRTTFSVKTFNWIGAEPVLPDTFDVKLRHGAALTQALVEKNEVGYQINLQANDQGIAAGQSAVLYQGTRCLGGGVIE